MERKEIFILKKLNEAQSQITLGLEETAKSLQEDERCHDMYSNTIWAFASQSNLVQGILRLILQDLENTKDYE